MEYLTSPIFRLLTWSTGAKKEEVGKVVLSFLALFFLLISYYIIKPLRTSKFLTEFDPNMLPLMSIGVVVLSLVVTKIFNYFGDRVEKYRLVAATFFIIVIVELIFGWLLTSASKPSVIAFYFFSSVYFMLALAATWACINDIFTPEQGSRCYGFIALGSTLGGIAGSQILDALTSTDFNNYAMFSSGLCMFIALGLLLWAAKARRAERFLGLIERSSLPDLDNKSEASQPQVRDFWSDVKGIFRNRYVFKIGVMVLSLAAYNSVIVEYTSGVALDRSISSEKFSENFSYLSQDDFVAISNLKSVTIQEREERLAKLATTSGQSLTKLKRDYQSYRAEYEQAMTKFYASVYFWQGVLGIFLLLVVARLIFVFAGARFATVVLPVLALISTLAFAAPLDLHLIEIIVVVIGSTNYSLNNAAKELLYTTTDQDTKFKYKPLIEGPGMRIGDLLANLAILAAIALGARLGWPWQASYWLILILMLVVIMFWLRAAYQAGKEFDAKRSQEQEVSSGS